ncbi:MAG TPA: hypothetical protein VJU59_08870 [Paraburkholderia sp.]|jgi:choline dehydrogenase-like flavoprotein|nr:hypothetical protein [Paraburkholderia sp.]HKR39778.1 hypothetical protein [Paraburkholderia sp.]
MNRTAQEFDYVVIGAGSAGCAIAAAIMVAEKAADLMLANR